MEDEFWLERDHMLESPYKVVSYIEDQTLPLSETLSIEEIMHVGRK